MVLFLLVSALAAPELCDGIDNDGDGEVDEGPVLLFPDLDSDGRGDRFGAVVRPACSAPSIGEVTSADDCDDGDSTVFSGAVETCNGKDDDCDGAIDEDGCSGFVRHVRQDSTYMSRNEFWGWGEARTACLDVAYDLVIIDDAGEHGFVVDVTDILNVEFAWIGLWDEDSNDSFFWVDGSPITYHNWQSGQPSLDAGDCGYTNTTSGWGDWLCTDQSDDTAAICEVTCTPRTWYLDADDDGFGDPVVQASACEAPPSTVANALDCDDNDDTIHATATEVCDGIDNDCDGHIDEGSLQAFFADLDGDGFGDASVATSACSAPAEFVGNDLDCDDADATAFPGADEVCDGDLEDCNGQVDEGLQIPFWSDHDNDGFGDATHEVLACSQPVGTVSNPDDCDDSRSDVYPGAPEQCDLVDNDCNGAVDDDVLDQQYYLDEDGDGFGSSVPGQVGCVSGAGEAANSDDCDDTNPLVSPAGTEVCNGIDDDCDGVVDSDSVVGTDTWYSDEDGDGFGDPFTPLLACSQPANTVLDATDCDDTDVLTHPGADEICDQADNDCDGTADEDLPVSEWYPDADGDGFGDGAAAPDTACGPSDSQVANATDCDDSDLTTFPGGVETCDGEDDDCDGQVDEGVTRSWYPDEDGDGFGDELATPLETCDPGTGFVLDNSDCDDTDVSINPDSTEIPDNAIDEDCDGAFASSQPPTRLDTSDTGAGTVDRTRLGLTCSHAARSDSTPWTGWLRF